MEGLEPKIQEGVDGIKILSHIAKRYPQNDTPTINRKRYTKIFDSHLDILPLLHYSLELVVRKNMILVAMFVHPHIHKMMML